MQTAFTTASSAQASLRGRQQVSTQGSSAREYGIGAQVDDAASYGFMRSAAAVAALGAATTLSVRRSARSRRTACAADAGDRPALRLFSPAKINLFLRIVRKRPDGYHDLASLFHAVAFGDTLDLELLPEDAKQDEFTCNMPGVPVDDSNLVIRAFKLFRDRSGVQRFFKANLVKTIPAQAGMGGGSSNAATAFFGANALCGNPATNDDLIKWTEDPVIGSDATFFLSEGTAYCTGRGEIITPQAPLPGTDSKVVTLVKPRAGLSTPKVFKAFDISGVDKTDPEDLLTTFKEKGVAHSSWINDLEKPAFEVDPKLGELKDFLKSADWGFESVMMSGSGSTIFCIGAPAGGKEALMAAAKEKGFDLEGVWQTRLLRRNGAEDKWYDMPAEA
eukprot:TRINITY_DN112345_c0_g1_i1.p1 TRINITY_DN112345_c0_g1~~TRINITY_DN112345_c0_g1_i1.p1  ORF type:complete len:455 (-),score=124.25 TRINITY_DN112345_c0_g1_i1:215-1384(-)